MAEREGFEPPDEDYPSMVFKTTAFDRSATSPFIFKTLFYSVSGRFKTVIIYQLKPSLVALWSHYFQTALSGHS